jgi:dihydrofolate reductase
VVSLLVARSSNGVIGRDGDLPWRLPSDLKRFRELTTGHSVLMGRRTFESLPAAFRPLPNRRNLILSSDGDYPADGAEVFTSLSAALQSCRGECFVIGGGITYEEALPFADRIYATEVEGEVDGDTYFPALPAEEWGVLQRGDPIVENGHTFAFCVYERVN